MQDRKCIHCDGTGTEKRKAHFIQTRTRSGHCTVIAFDQSNVLAASVGNSYEECEKEIKILFPDAKTESRAEFAYLITSNFHDIKGGHDILGDMVKFTTGTKFQQSVWREIMKIPYGKTKTYKDIAIALGKPKSVRAVANACGANIIAIIVPCHRVVKSNGELGGYRWGEKIKKNLIEQESYDSFLLATQSYKQKWRA